MSSQYNPFGLRPAFSPSGVLRVTNQNTIVSGYGTSIFQYSPVRIDADGYVIAAAAGSDALGCFMGVEWTDADGRRRYSNKWVAATVATDIVTWITQYQMDYVYEIQCNASLIASPFNPALPGSQAFGSQADWTTLAGNLITGLSSVGLDVATAQIGSGNAGLRIVGLTPGPDNAWNDAYPVVQVQISEHPLVADVAAI